MPLVPTWQFTLDRTTAKRGRGNTAGIVQRLTSARESKRGGDHLTDATDQRNSDCQLERSVIDAVDGNAQLLQQLLEQFGDMREAFLHGQSSSDCGDDQVDGSMIAAECQQLRDRIYDLEDQVGELQAKNNDLASKVAKSNAGQSVSTSTSSGSSDALSWDERKKLIIQQLEDDSFDAEAFVEAGSGEIASEDESPSQFVQRLCADLASREEEIQELRRLVDQQRSAADEATTRAEAVEAMVNVDEQVQQELARLQELHAQWEEKYRQGEIEASLERAELSRERQTLVRNQTELEVLLENARRECQQGDESCSGPSRRWLVKLGLHENGG